jgi:hypothetical protein
MRYRKGTGKSGRLINADAREQAIRRGEKTYDNGLECIYGHRGLRYTSSARCIECQRLSAERNWAKILEQQRARYHLDPDVRQRRKEGRRRRERAKREQSQRAAVLHSTPAGGACATTE